MIFKIVYFGAIVAQIVIRAPYAKLRQGAAKTDQRGMGLEQVLLTLLTIIGLVLPLIYALTGWLAFADYHLPTWLGWTGVALLGLSLLVFYFGHRDLKANWSPTLEIHADHTLVTDGIYHYIRHPMYASQLLWVIATPLLIQNWIAGPLYPLFFIPWYYLRVSAEEKMMLDTFGSEYAAYMKKVGGLFPRF